jgi:hypothetical protein
MNAAASAPHSKPRTGRHGKARVQTPGNWSLLPVPIDAIHEAEYQTQNKKNWDLEYHPCRERFSRNVTHAVAEIADEILGYVK